MTKKKTPEAIAKSKQIRDSKAVPNKSQLTRYRNALKHANAVNRTLDNVNVRKDAEIFELKEALAYVEARRRVNWKPIHRETVLTRVLELIAKLGLVDHIIAKPELLKHAAPSSEWLKHSPTIAYTTLPWTTMASGIANDGELRKAV